MSVKHQFKGYPAGAAPDFEDWPVGPAGEGEPKTDVIREAGVDGIVEVGINGVGVVHRPIVDCRSLNVDPGRGRGGNLWCGPLMSRLLAVEAECMKHLAFGLAIVVAYFVFPACTGAG